VYDVAVIGLGAAGSAALSALARAGVAVVGLDRFSPPHERGSSHGETRLLRVAYAEGAQYVPMARRAIELWRALETRTHTELFRQTGVVYAGPTASPFLSASLASARIYDVAVDDLGRAERDHLRARLFLPSDWLCCAEREGGYLLLENAITAFLADAREHGAHLRTGALCRAVETETTGVRIVTDAGEIRAGRCVVAAGAWTPALLPHLAPHLHIERKTLHWFADPQRLYGAGAFRPFLTDDDDGRQFYGFPDCGTGVKIAEHTEASARHADETGVGRAITAEDIAPVAAFAERHCPALGPLTRSETCLYPMSRDGHFVIERHPESGRIVVAAGLSGHGFKFAPVIGEMLADLALERAPAADVTPFSSRRF
jgi:sarcosine oxidase